MRSLLLFFVIFFSFSGEAQELISWEFSYDKKAEVFTAKAKLAEGWHLYSQYGDPEAGPVPTSFAFTEHPAYKRSGKMSEPAPKQQFDPNFGGNVSYFEKSVEFNQKLKVSEPFELEGTVTYMLCDDKRCIPPQDKEFKLQILE